MNYLKNPWTYIIILKLVIAYLLVHFHISLAEIEQLEAQIQQAQAAILATHEANPHLLGLEPGCADEWHQFWAWLTNNACAGGSR